MTPTLMVKIIGAKYWKSLLISPQSMNWVNNGSDNGLPPGRRQAIIWTNADILSIKPQGTYFN